MSLISAENSLAVFACIAALAWIGLLAERTAWGRLLTGLVWTGGLAILLANVGVIPQRAEAYDFIKAYLVPMAIPLFLFRVNLREIFRETGKTLIAFVIGAAATVLGTLIGLFLIDLGDLRSELAGVFVATYTGGSMNFAATAQALQLDDDAMLSAALAADSIVGKSYLMILALLPALAIVRRLYGQGDDSLHVAVADSNASAMGEVDAYRLISGLALSVVICATGYWAAGLAGIPQFGILFVTLFALIPGTAFPAYTKKLNGSFEMGTIFAYLFFAAVAAGADVSALIEIAPTILFFAIIIVIVHALIIFPAGRAMGLSLAEVITASNACILGPTTAAALAAARGWRGLVTPGLLAGVFGYAVGTFLGVMMANLVA